MTSPSGIYDKPSAGDPLPAKCSVIEVHVGELKQLFNAIDPSPFRDKDLDPKAEEFIVGWAKDLPRDATLALVFTIGIVLLPLSVHSVLGVRLLPDGRPPFPNRIGEGLPVNRPHIWQDPLSRSFTHSADGQVRYWKEFTLGLASRSPDFKRKRRTGCVFLE